MRYKSGNYLLLIILLLACQIAIASVTFAGFIDSGQNLGGSASEGVALSDLDGDGDVDAFVANWNQANSVWLNNGSGTFTDSGQLVADQGAGTPLPAVVQHGDRNGGPAPNDVRSGSSEETANDAILPEADTDRQKEDAGASPVRVLEERSAEEHAAAPAELRIGVGIFVFADDGADFTVSFRPPESHWQFGYRYVRWTEVFNDPFTNRKITRTTYTLQGPQVNYQFRPEENGTWYLGSSVLEYSSTEVFLPTGASDSDSTITLFVGGGYTGHIGKHVFFDLGMFLAPWAESKTDTGKSSEEASGLFDIQCQIGFVF